MWLHYGDFLVSGSLRDLVCQIQPDEICCLGAQSYVRSSFDMPEYNLVKLEDIKSLKTSKRF